ncbi:MAG: PA2779 family protein [bacterium]|nr:PA2779 family protein [bacterium]
MMMNKSLKTTALILIASMGFASLPVQAMVMTTAEVTAPLQVVSAERARVAALLARADVQSGLARYGVSSEQAAARVAALSDDEVMQLGQRLDTVPAGGDIIGVVVFIFLVLLITDILGFTKIFPFTRSIR